MIHAETTTPAAPAAPLPRIVPLGDAWPWPLASDARRAGDPAWFETTAERFDDALEAVPPRLVKGFGMGSAFYMGEPSAHDDRGIVVHALFYRSGTRYFMREVPVDKGPELIAELLGLLAR